MITTVQKDCFSVQFITHCNDRYTYLQSAEMALRGHCKWIQLRMKNSSKDERRQMAQRVQELCKHYQAVFIVDDDVDLCMEIKADGVHLGKNDMPIEQARTLLGEKYIIGATCNQYEDIERAKKNGADYIGLGPFRYTLTKVNLNPILGIEGYQTIIQQCKSQQINLPIVAIGGITENDIEILWKTKINSIAISGEVLNADHPIQKMINIVQKINRVQNFV